MFMKEHNPSIIPSNMSPASIVRSLPCFHPRNRNFGFIYASLSLFSTHPPSHLHHYPVSPILHLPKLDSRHHPFKYYPYLFVYGKYFSSTPDLKTRIVKYFEGEGDEEALPSVLYWDKLLPEDIKQKVQAKYDELAEKMENNGLEVEKAYEQFKVFEDEIVAEHIKKDEEERLVQESDEVAKPVDNKSDDPPGVGPILRWQTRLVLVPGGDAWHPKNRKVKLSVTVKELGLSKHQFRRMREIVGKRYHSGKDELTITSERFEHREENRKDCLRTLLSIIEEAGKADALVDEARTAYVKQRLKANPAFMAGLHAKTKQTPTAIPA